MQLSRIVRFACVLQALTLAACGGGGGSGVPAVTVTVAPATASVMVGQQIQLSATVTDAMGNVLPGSQVTWASSNTSIATVNSAGLVVAVALGQVTIKATHQGDSGTAVLTTTTGINFVDVSAGDSHTCGETSQGLVYCWGDNSSGQLGNGTTNNSTTPVPVAGGIIFGGPLRAGRKHTCGVTNVNNQAGPLYCWGDNSSGQLGNGTTTNSLVPVAVLGGFVFDDVTTGGDHTCARTVTVGAGYCWGDNSSGQLGNGTTTNSSIPVAIPVVPGWYDLSAGSNHTCGVTSVGIVGAPMVTTFCWGDNSAGQFGNGTTTSSATPLGVLTGPLGFAPSIVSAGALYSCGLDGVNNIASCWGDNGYGQLGNGTTANSTTPVSLTGKFSIVSTGARHACAISAPSNGIASPFCWGDNSSGQLGNGTMTNATMPTTVTGGLSIAVISAGGHHTCGVAYAPGATVGAVYCWGDNTYGQLGNNWTTSSAIPVNVAGQP